MGKTRQWSDGRHADAERLAALHSESAQASALGVEIINLRLRNEWLRLQLAYPWRIENYRPRPRPPETGRYSSEAA